jgi:hypothetical protein
MTEPHVSREALVHQLYEAAELEHNLMCTYLYAAFSLRIGTEEGLSAVEADATARWRRAMLKVAVEEMGHLTAVWNITAALGGSPRFGRLNFPLDPGSLPANVVVRLAPFSEAVLQHFIYLERPTASAEPDGEGFKPDFTFTRGDALADALVPVRRHRARPDARSGAANGPADSVGPAANDPDDGRLQNGRVPQPALAIRAALGCVWEINPSCVQTRGETRWACVALGGMDRWSTSASVALAERVSPLTHDEFISQTHPS